MAPKFLPIPAIVMKIRLADIHMRTVVPPVLSVIHTAIFNLTIADNFVTISYDDSYNKYILSDITSDKSRKSWSDHANFVIELVFWICIG